MVAYVEIVTCLAAIAGSVKWTASEYIRLRRDKQIRQALRLAVGELA